MGALTRVEITTQNDGEPYSIEYQKNVLRYHTSNPAIEKVWYHVPTKTLAYTHSKTNLFVRKSNGKIVNLDSTKSTYCKNHVEDCGTYEEVNFSPRAFFIFTEVHGLETCESSVFDIRTGKRANVNGCFDPTRDVYFSADATRMAIRVPFLEIEGASNDLLVVQDPKSLKFKKVFTFPEVNEKGIYRTGTIEKIEFNGEGLLHFSAIIKKHWSGTLRETKEEKNTCIITIVVYCRSSTRPLYHLRIFLKEILEIESATGLLRH